MLADLSVTDEADLTSMQALIESHQPPNSKSFSSSLLLSILELVDADAQSL